VRCLAAPVAVNSVDHMPISRPTTLALVVLFALAIRAREARAEWYGAGMIATDGAGWALAVGGALGESPAVVIGALGLTIIGTPLFHLEHKNYGRMGASFGMRLGATLLGFAIVNGSKSSSDGGGPPVLSGAGAVGGAVIALLAAQVIDIAFLAHDDANDAPAPRMFSIGGRF
jgi:hypothetical protein